MSNTYTSSIVFNYGDIDNMPEDCKTLREIIGRQGSRLLLEVIANDAGKTAVMFKLDETECQNIINNLVNELKELLRERL